MSDNVIRYIFKGEGLISRTVAGPSLTSSLIGGININNDNVISKHEETIINITNCNNIQGEVYWVARDLDALGLPGNHHFILIILDGQNDVECMKKEGFTIYTESSKNFITIAGHKVNERLKIIYNQASDIQAAREYFNPEKYIKRYKPDYDTEPQKITYNIPRLISRIITLAKNYEINEEKYTMDYSLYAQNCATLVNSIMKALGIPKPYYDRNVTVFIVVDII